MNSAPRTEGVRRSIFWRVAPALIGLQLIMAVFAAGFSIWYVSDSLRSLASAALTARIDATAEEIERRAVQLDGNGIQLGEDLRFDLGYRFPDALILLDLNGDALEPVWPAADGFDVDLDDTTWVIPEFVMSDDAFDDIVIDFTDEFAPGGFGSAPLYDEAGFPVGILLVQPMQRTLEWEMADTRAAVRRAVRIVALISIVVALLFGAALTWWLVRPLRRMAGVVERMDGASPAVRIDISGQDEVAYLARTINSMADRIGENIAILKETDRLRRELVANVGHDLRTPLAAVRAQVEEAERFTGEGRDAEARQALASARRQMEYLSQLVQDLFELARLEGDARSLQREPVLPLELAQVALQMNTPQAEKHRVNLVLDAAGDVGLLQADGTRLLRLLNNLLSNAIRHSNEGADVRLVLTPEANTLRMDVVDTGSGMDEATLERLFDRYYRGDDARTRAEDHQRTGLGLAIAQAIALAHDGSLTATSALGQGTTMRVILPMATADSDSDSE